MPKNRKLTYSDRQSQASRDKKQQTTQPPAQKPADEAPSKPAKGK